jgi:hypothetical protein
MLDTSLCNAPTTKDQFETGATKRYLVFQKKKAIAIPLMLTFFNLHFCWWNGNCKPNGMKKKQHIAIIGDASIASVEWRLKD